MAMPKEKSKAEQMSLEFTDDDGWRCIERVFLLIEGYPQALEIALGVNAFKEETEKTNLTLTLTLQNIWIEYTNNLVRNLAEVGLAFNNASKLGNYTIPPSPYAMQRQIELYTPLYIVKESFGLMILAEDKMKIDPNKYVPAHWKSPE